MKVAHGDIYGCLNSTLINAKLSLSPPCSHPHLPQCFLREKEGTVPVPRNARSRAYLGSGICVGPACGSFLEWWQMVEILWQITRSRGDPARPRLGWCLFQSQKLLTYPGVLSEMFRAQRPARLSSALTRVLEKPLFFWVSPSFTWMWPLMQMQTKNEEVPPSCATSSVSTCESSPGITGPLATGLISCIPEVLFCRVNRIQPAYSALRHMDPTLLHIFKDNENPSELQRKIWFSDKPILWLVKPDCGRCDH